MNFFDSLSSIKLGDVSLSSVFSALIVYVLCYIAIKILCKAFEKILDSSRHIDASLKSFFRSAIKAVLWTIAVIIIAGTLGIPVTSLVAVLSVAGVALSLALQGLLSNLFSGITLLTTHPFKVGDYVEISGQSGTVKSIGLFYTGLATVDNRMIYAPNGSVTSGQIVNFSAEDLRRVIISVTASYDSATEDVRSLPRRDRHDRQGAQRSSPVCRHFKLRQQLDRVHRAHLVQDRGLLGCVFRAERKPAHML